MSRPTRIGIVGCGRILPAHLRAFKALKDAGLHDFRIVALAARKLDDALMFAKRGAGPPPRPPVSDNPMDPLAAPHMYVSDIHDDVAVQCYDDWRKMLDEADLDAVAITATLSVHHEIALAAMERGMHCMVEKPLAISVRAGRLMVESARRHGVRLAVTEVRRFSESTRIAETLVQKGVLGNVQMAAQFRIGAGDWSPNWVIANTPWRHQKLLAGGGATLDMGVHFINELRAICGEVHSVQGTTRTLEPVRYMKTDGSPVASEVDDVFFAHYEFDSGAIGQTTFSWAGHGEPIALPHRTVIYGSNGSLHDNRLVLDNEGEYEAGTYVREQLDPDFDARFFPGGIRDTFALAYSDWLGAIERGEEPEMSGREALYDLAAAFAICESSAAGRRVTLQEVLDGRVDGYQREIDEHYGLLGADASA